MADSERRRRRPAISCTMCRKRKIRCNRENPCSNCQRSKPAVCTYDSFPPPIPRARRSRDGEPVSIAPDPGAPGLPTPTSGSDQASSGGGRTVAATCSSLWSAPAAASPAGSSATATTNTSAGAVSLQEVEAMRARLRQLEEQLAGAGTGSARASPAAMAAATHDATIETTASGIAGTYHINQERSLRGETQVSRSIVHKTRFLGQTHWSNSFTMFLDVFEIIEPHVRVENSKATAGLKRCKYLARIIKSQREPAWPCTASSDLPPRSVADELVACYLRTTETIFRVLHVPSFRKDYEALWALGASAAPDPGFLVQLKLVLAIGAATYDDRFSLRTSAIRWVHEALMWVAEPEFKQRLTFQSLQISTLLLIARDMASVGAGLIWVSVGALVRSAIYMGLHRDPSHLPKKPILVAEMRRRLWSTILEIAVQSSLQTGGPPLISLEDFDTQPPGNFEDEQLLDDQALARPEDDFTQVSVSIALRKTLPARLAVVRFLNRINSSGDYNDTLRQDAELRAVYKTLCQTLQGYKSSVGRSASQFELLAVDLIMRRYLVVLHLPFFGAALYEAAFAFSRKVVIEGALGIWSIAYPSTSAVVTQQLNSAPSSDRNSLTRMIACGTGFFRVAALQSCMLLVAELRNQLQEEENLGPIPLRPDLISVLEDAKIWSWSCIEAGETNVKGYLLICMVAAQIDLLMRGIARDEVPEMLVKSTEEALNTCLGRLEQEAAQGQAEGAADEINQMSLNGQPEMENWDFTMSDDMFDFGTGGTMNGFFYTGTAQGSSLW